MAPAPIVAASATAAVNGRDQPDIEVRRREPGQGLDADIGQLVVSGHRDQCTGRHGQEADDHDGAADDRERPGAQAHLRDQPNQLGSVVHEHIHAVAQSLGVEPCLGTDPVPAGPPASDPA